MSVDGVNVISRRHRVAGAVGLRAERLRVRRHPGLAQEPRAHRRVLFHRAARRLRDAHRPPGERRRHRRRRVPRKAAARHVARRTDRSRARRAASDASDAEARAPAADARIRAGTRRRAPTRRARARNRRAHAGGTLRRNRCPAPAPLAKLGTGHGRSEESPAQMVRFERESATPNETIAIHYDRRENLVAMGILPPPVIARTPNPFPGVAALRPGSAAALTAARYGPQRRLRGARPPRILAGDARARIRRCRRPTATKP